VESSGGVLGLRVEGARTNFVQRSDAFDNAYWAKTDDGSGAGVPTVTANFAVSPDGTTNAERIQFNSCTTAGFISKVQSSHSSTTVPGTFAVYVRGNGTSGSLSLCTFIGTGSCSTCSYVSGSWTRCTHTANASGVTFFNLGCTNSGSYSGGAGGQPAQDVLVYGFQGEDAAYATSYIPTVASAVTRNAETTSLTSAVLPLTGSAAVTSQRPYGNALAPNQTLVDALVSTSSGWRFSFVSSQLRIEKGGPLASVGTATTWAAGESPRWAASFDGANASLFVNGTVLIGPSALAGFTSPIYTPVALGWDHQGFASFDGIVSRVCVDPDPTRCR